MPLLKTALFAGPILLSPLGRATDTYWAPLFCGIALILLHFWDEHQKQEDASGPPPWLRQASGYLYVALVVVVIAGTFGTRYWDQLATLTVVWLTTVLGSWKSAEPATPLGQIAVGMILPLLGGIALLTSLMRFGQGAIALALAMASVGILVLIIGFTLLNGNRSASSFTITCLGIVTLAVGLIEMSQRISIQDWSTLLSGSALLIAAPGIKHDRTRPLAIAGMVTVASLAANTLGGIQDSWWLSSLSAATAIVATSFLVLSVTSGNASSQRTGLGLGAVSIILASASMFSSGQRVFGSIAMLSGIALFVASLSNMTRLTRTVKRIALRATGPRDRLHFVPLARRLRKLAQRDTKLNRLGVLQLAILVATTHLTVVWALYK